MKLVIFGLTISSSWGNGHATLWRGLCRALAALSHQVVFYERDVPYYSNTRDLFELERGKLVLYPNWEQIADQAAKDVADADAAIVTSYCPDGILATELVLNRAGGMRVFYDLDTPITLDLLEKGLRPDYIGERGLRDFDCVLSYTGGHALDLLVQRLGARAVVPIYGHVDPASHRPESPVAEYRSCLSYLGTYSEDRQATVDELLLEPARRLPSERFVLGGSMYPDVKRFPPNLVHFNHVPPRQHSALYCSGRMTLNVTRSTMARFGYCPSGRLFEAAACGVPIVSDWFEGLDQFFELGLEIRIATNQEEVLEYLRMSDQELRSQAARARRRTLDQHSALCRAKEIERVMRGHCR
jgi:spore maturation protein CgeB